MRHNCHYDEAKLMDGTCAGVELIICKLYNSKLSSFIVMVQNSEVSDSDNPIKVMRHW